MHNVCYGTIVFIVIFGGQCSVISIGIPIRIPNINSYPYSSGAHNPAHGKPIFLKIYPRKSDFNNGYQVYQENKLFRPMVPGTAKPSTYFPARAAEHGPLLPLRLGLHKVGVPVPNYESNMEKPYDLKDSDHKVGVPVPNYGYNVEKPYDLKDPDQRLNNGFQTNNPLQPFAHIPGPFSERKYGSNTMDYDLKIPDQLLDNGFQKNNPLQPCEPIPGPFAYTMSADGESKKHKHHHNHKHRGNGSKRKDRKRDRNGGREEGEEENDRRWRGGAAIRSNHEEDEEDDNSNRRHRHHHRSKGATQSRDSKDKQRDSDRNQEPAGQGTEGGKDGKSNVKKCQRKSGQRKSGRSKSGRNKSKSLERKQLLKDLRRNRGDENEDANNDQDDGNGNNDQVEGNGNKQKGGNEDGSVEYSKDPTFYSQKIGGAIVSSDMPNQRQPYTQNNNDAPTDPEASTNPDDQVGIIVAFQKDKIKKAINELPEVKQKIANPEAKKV